MLERFVARLTVNTVTIALIVMALAIQTARIEGFKIWPLSVKGYKAEANELRAKLREILTPKNEQKRETARNVERAKDRIGQAEPKARRIETAPLPGNCATPKEIMSADI